MVGFEELPPAMVNPPELEVHANVSGLLPTGLNVFDASGLTVIDAGIGANSGLWMSMVGPPTITIVGGVVAGGTVGILTVTITVCVTVAPDWPVAIQV